ncbi:hypothetical protein RMSM_02901 [Rhodopirellula maiorica SM1]|uniref:Uncharacterized protein n=1 Tax=Rhodopirellula maiorica SM1 TaxID=1265738 RepID=M5RLT6_9BACT|nr:hypothetical protein RMSM_02901 [Rhodopirellula maiorica SM1]
MGDAMECPCVVPHLNAFLGMTAGIDPLAAFRWHGRTNLIPGGFEIKTVRRRDRAASSHYPAATYDISLAGC